MDSEEELEPTMEEYQQKNNFQILPISPSLWLTSFITLQADLFYNCFAALFSPFFFLLSLLFPQPDTKGTAVESAVIAAAGVPSKVVRGGGRLLKNVGRGFLAAVYVCLVLTVLLVLAFVIGVGLVQSWVEEPVILKENLHFDYTEIHPEAIFSFDGRFGARAAAAAYSSHKPFNWKKSGVPVGHTFYVSLLLLVPESDYNREIGVFQITAEVISSKREITERSSYPCMLQFRSWPIRIIRTLLMGLPLLLGITAETQTMKIPMLKHKEGFPRTEAIRITLIPRAGTDWLPQLYEAKLLLNSQLPWKKELVRRWKWTFYVWTSFYVYIALVMLLLCCFRPLIFPVLTMRSPSGHGEEDLEVQASGKTEEDSGREETDVAESLRRWQQSKRKRKAMLMQCDIGMPELEASSATSISLKREETGANLEDDTGDSESVCS